MTPEEFEQELDVAYDNFIAQTYHEKEKEAFKLALRKFYANILLVQLYDTTLLITKLNLLKENNVRTDTYCSI